MNERTGYRPISASTGAHSGTCARLREPSSQAVEGAEKRGGWPCVDQSELRVFWASDAAERDCWG